MGLDVDLFVQRFRMLDIHTVGKDKTALSVVGQADSEGAEGRTVAVRS